MSILTDIQTNKNQCLDNPAILSEYILKLSSHIITAEREKTEAEVAYTHKWVAERENCTSDKQCDQKMKLTEEYIELRSKEAMAKTVLETIRSAKKRLAFLLIEYNENFNK